MKKCPNCQKTYEDNLKYCQSDGSPLVVVAEDTPSDDPYKTMVASDLKLPVEELAEFKASEPNADAPQIENEAEDTSAAAEMDDDGGDVLEIPDSPEPVDPMKTVVVSGADTSDNISVANVDEVESAPVAPVNEPEAADSGPLVEEPFDSEGQTMLSPEIPKFSEPDIEPPDLGDTDSGSLGGKQTDAGQPGSKSSVPIPSPFDESMPPGFAPPDTPPFEAEGAKVESEPPPASPFTDQQDKPSGTEDWDLAAASSGVPVDASGSAPFGSNEIMASGDSLAADAEGANKTLALVSLVSGIAGVLCCAAGILLGPIALITGYMAKGKINEDPSVYGGATFANVGMILGVVGVILSIIVIGLNIFSVAWSF